MASNQEVLKRLKQATAEAIEKAKAVGDQDGIEQLAKIDAIADELVHKSRSGPLSALDILNIGLLFERFVRILRELFG